MSILLFGGAVGSRTLITLLAKQAPESLGQPRLIVNIGSPGMIRTRDQNVNSVLLLPTELRGNKS